ncbi:Uncharacterised protein [Legionella busanensis]|uniref:Uncharacterized protein n=1 Tax=Legionella busanensis TaxID=190655 RepID=A0A378KAI8_9GAMM|nr:hypothetical protein [Legionella busanensis]STX81667.1 Uncharacterised protein [Legionella busanensis]STX81726.1 Uncharacterised protein [Legionella busanensis]
MPTLDELTKKSKIKFKKSDYRPWNYMDELDKESNSNQLEVKKESPSKVLETNDDNKFHKNFDSKIIEEKIVAIPAEPIFHNTETALDIIFRITGHQKKIFLFIIERCLIRGMLSTGVIKGETLAEITQTSLKMVKTSIQRLIHKNLILREKGKTGRGGFYSFRITEVVRNAALEYRRMVKLDNPLEINSESYGNQLGIKKELVSEKKSILPPEWEGINILPLEHIGFNKSHLIDIFETGLIEPQVVQESILHYSYGLEYESTKYKQYDNPLNVFIGRLRKGKPWFESNYRSPQELAQLELIKAKKNEVERIKQLEEEAYKLALAEWQGTLTQDEIKKITAKKNNHSDFMPQNAKLSLYFKDVIWPLKKTDYLILE